jgi:hypothetical protein
VPETSDPMAGMQVVEHHHLAEIIESALDGIIDRALTGLGPLKGAVAVAEEHRHPDREPEEAIEALIRTHVRLAGTSGFVTGLGGIAVLPLALPVGVGALYFVAGRMTAGIAHLRGYDVGSEEVRSAVAVCLLGSAGVEVVKQAGVKAGNRFLASAVRRMSAQPLKAINRAVGFRLVTRAGSTGVVNLSRSVPFIGGPISAAFDIAPAEP